MVRDIEEGITRELVVEDDNAKSNDDTMKDFPRLTEEMARYLRPLYVRAHFEGRPISRVLIDNGVIVNILRAATMRRIGKYKLGLILDDLLITNFTGEQT